MIGVLDSQSVYLDRETFRDLQISRPLAGLGLDIIMEKGSVRVVTPIDDRPAAKAGVTSTMSSPTSTACRCKD